MNRNGGDASGGEPSNNDNVNRKRRRNDAASSGGRRHDNNHRGHHRGHGKGDSRADGRGGRGRGNNNNSNNNFAGGERHDDRSSNGHGRGSVHHNNNRSNHRGGGRQNMRINHHHRHGNKRHNHSKPSSIQNNNYYSVIGVTTKNVVTASSSEASSLANDSDTNTTTVPKQQKNQGNMTIAILPWPNPHSHYIPVGEEERILPALIHWGQSERGMMKDQPSFRMQKIQKVLENDQSNGTNSSQQNGKRHNNSHRHDHNGNEHDGHHPLASSSTQEMSIIQSLSLRRHHLKLLNPRLSMTALRLGNVDDIRDAAALFEDCVDAYLRSHKVHFWSEEDQREKFERSTKGVPYHRRKQPPTPDFMMKEGHSVELSFATTAKSANNHADDDSSSSSITHPAPIYWIEAKMFYGANTIPSGTPNAVGCILPKVRDYVRLYGTGAIVFMYGCGHQLAEQLLEVGVVALDGRGLDLDRVERQQKRWW